MGCSQQDAPGRVRAGGEAPHHARAYALSSGYYDAYYLKAQKVRTLIRQELQQVFEEFDVLATPTSPSVAFRFGERTADPVQMYLSDVCTVPANIAGIPGISVPAGLSDGLPVGLQLLGPHLSERRCCASRTPTSRRRAGKLRQR